LDSSAARCKQGVTGTIHKNPDRYQNSKRDATRQTANAGPDREAERVNRIATGSAQNADPKEIACGARNLISPFPFPLRGKPGRAGSPHAAHAARQQTTLAVIDAAAPPTRGPMPPCASPSLQS